MTLLEKITDWMVIQKNKHDLGEDYEIDYINNMTNYELLVEISEALGEL
jgi:hypothetical protein